MIERNDMSYFFVIFRYCFLFCLGVGVFTQTVGNFHTSAFGARPNKILKNKKSQTLLYVMNYPYQITGKGKTKIHLVLFKPDFKPAKGARVTINRKRVCVTDHTGTCIFDYQPGHSKSHTLRALLKEKGIRYTVNKSFSSKSRTSSFASNQLFVYTEGLFSERTPIVWGT